MNNCELNVPYPKVMVQGKNLNYAALLTNDFGGVVSEMSAVTKYVYQHLITANEEIKKTVDCIARVEMIHLELIGKLIFAFGGNPRIGMQSGCSMRYWTGQYLCYEQNPRCYLKDNISNEFAAIANYKMRLEQVCDQGAQKVIERIIMDEEHHIKIFNELLQKCSQ